ncbi:MAG: DNA methyltransferase [Jatrophihabitans sp.]|nr:MAG: DNA methyltransferase [Jatrophihabitans sp.]
MALHQAILRCVESIPRGRVMSYGDIAEYCGANTPRLVGHVLRVDGGTVPWHRVVRADGSLATHKSDHQRELLEVEGVRFRGERVDIARYRWDGAQSTVARSRASCSRSSCSATGTA